jgi:hypothetical protein
MSIGLTELVIIAGLLLVVLAAAAVGIWIVVSRRPRT